MPKTFCRLVATDPPVIGDFLSKEARGEETDVMSKSYELCDTTTNNLVEACDTEADAP